MSILDEEAEKNNKTLAKSLFNELVKNESLKKLTKSERNKVLLSVQKMLVSYLDGDGVILNLRQKK